MSPSAYLETETGLTATRLLSSSYLDFQTIDKVHKTNDDEQICGDICQIPKMEPNYTFHTPRRLYLSSD